MISILESVTKHSRVPSNLTFAYCAMIISCTCSKIAVSKYLHSYALFHRNNSSIINKLWCLKMTQWLINLQQNIYNVLCTSATSNYVIQTATVMVHILI